MNNKVKKNLWKAGTAMTLALAMVVPCAALVGNAAEVEETAEADSAALTGYRIEDFEILEEFTIEADSSGRFYHSEGMTTVLMPITGTYERIENDPAMRMALENAYADNGFTRSLSYASPQVVIGAGFQSGYYELKIFVKAAHVAFTVVELSGGEYNVTYTSGRDAVPKAEQQPILKVYYYKTMNQDDPDRRYPISEFMSE